MQPAPQARPPLILDVDPKATLSQHVYGPSGPVCPHTRKLLGRNWKVGISLRRAEFIVNVAIVVAAVLLGGLLVKRYFLTTSDLVENRNYKPPILAGTRISLPGLDWGKNGETLLVVVSSGCHFCSESAPFYRRLLQEVEGSKVRLVAVLPQQVGEGKSYLNSINVPIDEVRQAPLSSLGVSGTPTLILVSGTGVVMDSWLGKLPAERESEVLNRLHSNRGG